LWNRVRPDLLRQLPTAGEFLVTRPAGVANPEGVPLTWTNVLGDNDALRRHAYDAPIFFHERKRSTPTSPPPRAPGSPPSAAAHRPL
jgi:hypothetical protein